MSVRAPSWNSTRRLLVLHRVSRKGLSLILHPVHVVHLLTPILLLSVSKLILQIDLWINTHIWIACGEIGLALLPHGSLLLLLHHLVVLLAELSIVPKDLLLCQVH